MKIKPLKLRKSEKKSAAEIYADEQAIILKRKKRRLKYIAVLPSIITLMNGACGFVAIFLVSRSTELTLNLFFMRENNITLFALACYMICFGMVADTLDGRIARLTRTTSSFGGQLDSLTDAITFGVAPALIVVNLVEFHLQYLSFDHMRFFILIERATFFAAIFYLMCALIRLARFNVENDEDEAAHMYFTGLPSPSAAGVVVSLVIFQQQFMHRINYETSAFFNIFQIITVTIIPLLTFLTGILMVSRIRYPHVASQLFRAKKSLPAFLVIVATAIFFVWNIQLALLIGFCGFAFYGVLRWLVSLFPGMKGKTAKSPQQED